MTDTIHYYQCPLCGCHALKQHVTATDRLVSGKQFTIVKCDGCGLFLTQDAPSATAIGQYYQSVKYLPHNGQRTAISFLYRIARSLMFHRKLSLIHRYSKRQHGALIDVGAGDGHFMAFMRRRGWQVTGCEQSGHARAEAEKKFGLQIDGDVMSCNYPSENADVITAWHAVEHIHELHAVWDRFNCWLKPEGTLFVAVPNCDSWDAKYYGGNWAAWDVPRHLWHFNEKSITDLASQHGFVMVGSHPLPIDACYIALLSERNKIKAIINSLRFMLLGARD